MYVDGYNFYYAIKQKYRLDRIRLRQESLIGLGWCDFRRLGEHMIDRNAEQITEIKYFTARVETDDPGFAGERQRQQDWLDAVSTITGLRKIMGYLSSILRCGETVANRSAKSDSSAAISGGCRRKTSSSDASRGSSCISIALYRAYG